MQEKKNFFSSGIDLIVDYSKKNIKTVVIGGENENTLIYIMFLI
jgi:hypothetical protein